MSHHEENLITGRKYWQIIHLLEDVYPKYKEHIQFNSKINNMIQKRQRNLIDFFFSK